MNNMMKILSRVVLIAAFGILFSFMSKTEVKADDLEFVSASIDAPSEVVKGQNYSITVTFTFNRTITQTDHPFVSSKIWLGTSGYGTGFTSGYNDNSFIQTLQFSIPLNATGNLEIWALFDNVEKDRKTMPIVDPAPTTYTVTFEPNGGNFNGSTTAATRTTGTAGTLTEFPEVQYDGHTLVGWFDDAADPNTAVGLDKVYTGATTLTAHWTETPSYHTVTYHVLNGKWNDDTTGDKTEGDILHGSYPNHVPPVGSKPNAGYKAGSWDTNPSSVTITGNSNFTYTYVSDTPSSSSKKSDDSDHYESSPAPAPKPVNPNAIISTSFSFKGTAVNSSFGKGVIKIGPQEQGTAAQLAFRLNTPAGWREAFSFNMTVNNETTYDPKRGTLSFTIPTRYQKDGRKFAILGIDQYGKVKRFYDKDATADTITVHLIDFPGYAFDLIYVD